MRWTYSAIARPPLPLARRKDIQCRCCMTSRQRIPLWHKMGWATPAGPHVCAQPAPPPLANGFLTGKYRSKDDVGKSVRGDRVFPGVSESNQRYFYEHWRKVTSEDEES